MRDATTRGGSGRAVIVISGVSLALAACVPGTPMFGVLPTSPSLIALASTDKVRADAEPAFVGGVARIQDVAASIIDPVGQMPSAILVNVDGEPQTALGQHADDAKANDEVAGCVSANLVSEKDGIQ
jgi:hypothetical protein